MTRILFNCDDFGKTAEVNAAVLQAHREGVLRSASLMVTGGALDAAVDIAKANPSLKVGLHLALSDATPVLPREQIPDLTDSDGRFFSDPAVMGMRMAFCWRTRAQAAMEIVAQFERFITTGLKPAHVDGHHHLHMHPFVFRECVQWSERLGFARIRVVREAAGLLPPRRDGSLFAAKFVRHLTFLALAAGCERFLVSSRLEKLDGVLGLWETGRMSEEYLLEAIPQLPPGDWEIYNHVGAEGAGEELKAMLSPSLKRLLEERKIACL